MPRTRKANTPKRKRMHAHVELSMKRRGYSAKRAAMAANSVVAKDVRRKKRKRR